MIAKVTYYQGNRSHYNILGVLGSVAAISDNYLGFS